MGIARHWIVVASATAGAALVVGGGLYLGIGLEPNEPVSVTQAESDPPRSAPARTASGTPSATATEGGAPAEDATGADDPSQDAPNPDSLKQTRPNPTAPSPASPDPTPVPAPVPPAVPVEPSPEPTPTLPEPEPEPEAVNVPAVLGLVNAERAAVGLAPLAASGELASAAQAHASSMAANGATYQSGGAGGWSAWGENVAQGPGSASSVVGEWMSSAGNSANILNPAYTSMGVGYVAEGNYWSLQLGG